MSRTRLRWSLMDAISVDEAFTKFVGHGRAQWKYFFVINICSIISAFHIYATTFVDFTPAWRCQDKDTINSVDLCNYVESDSCIIEYRDGSLKTSVMEWELFCSRSYLARLPQSALFLGTLVSNFVAGPFGDKYGRQKLLVLSIFFQSLFGILSSFSYNVYIYIGLRFFVGVVAQGAILGVVVWIFELCDSAHRCAMQSYGNILFILGSLSMPVLSLLMPNWRTLLLVTSTVSILPVFLLSWVPKSPSWLLVSGRREEAQRVLCRIAEQNGTVPQEFQLQQPANQEAASKGFFSLFSFPEIACRTVVLLICWFTCCVTYYGVTFALGDSLGGNRYVNFALGVIVEVPSIFISIYLADRFGRRVAFSRTLFISGACLVCSFLVSRILTGFAQPEIALLAKVGFAICGKCFITAAFAVAYFFASELFPTEVRNVGLGLVSVASRLGGALSPFVLSAGNQAIPICLMGLLSVFAGFCALKLPETKDSPTPDTLEELRAK